MVRGARVVARAVPRVGREAIDARTRKRVDREAPDVVGEAVEADRARCVLGDPTVRVRGTRACRQRLAAGVAHGPRRNRYELRAGTAAGSHSRRSSRTEALSGLRSGAGAMSRTTQRSRHRRRPKSRGTPGGERCETPMARQRMTPYGASFAPSPGPRDSRAFADASLGI